MPVLGLDHINYRVPADLLIAMKDFYCDVVGLTVGERPDFGSVGFWLYAGGHPVIHLSTFKGETSVDPQLKNAFDHVAFRCDKAAQAERDLTAAGVHYAIRHFPDQGLSQIFLRDPAGNTVELNCPLAS
jgi:catechol-2,3-dioxygenase